MLLRQRRHHGWTWVRSLRFQEEEPPGPSKFRTRARNGGSNKGCFFVTGLTGKTLTMTTPLDSSVSSLAHDIATVTCIPVERFYFVVAGPVLRLVGMCLCVCASV